jgi:psp operon transcriptional activator
VDVRVIGATNTDLRIAVAENRFRADLLDRLSFDVVHMPALRQRPEDIVELAQHFALQMCAELGWNLFAGFTDTALQTLRQYHWPGNIRELKNAVERSLFRWDHPEHAVDKIVIDPFPSPFRDGNSTTTAPETDDEIKQIEKAVDFHTQVALHEVQLLRAALTKNGHNQRRAATALGISYDQMRGLVRKYHLADQRSRKRLE